MKILLTGIAGFIGYHTAKKLLEIDDVEIVGLDQINDYYDINLKFDRLADLGFLKDEAEKEDLVQSAKSPNLSFIRMSLEEKEKLSKLFNEENFDYVIHLAAQAGVRHSLTHPEDYINRNLIGTFNLFEAAKDNLENLKHFVYASSSSVYGTNTKIPFSENDKTEKPLSLYAMTKKSNELMAHSYSNMYKLPTTGLRFFTVYGPWGRPDMAMYLFANGILKGEEIQIFNNGDMQRDFTYVDDVVTGIVKVMTSVPKAEIPYEIFNIGNGAPVDLMECVHTIEKYLGKKAKIKYMPLQKGDVKSTFCDTSKLEREIGYKPEIGIDEGVKKLIEWYKEYYKI